MQGRKDAIRSVGIRTNFHFQFISTPTSDTPGTSLALNFDTKKYIFGELSEGTQRACIQRGVGLRKVRGLFLAGKTHWNNGGLIGLILTMADVQQGEVEDDGSRRPRLHIHAGPKQLHSLACARRFVFRTGMPLSVHEFDVKEDRLSPGPIFEDSNIRVWGISAQYTKPLASSSTDEEDLDQFQDVAGGELQRNQSDESSLDSEQALRKGIVNAMFDSDWHRDQLVECQLKEVKLPAVVWVRDPDTKTLTQHTCSDHDKTGSLTAETIVLVRNPWPASKVEELPGASALPGRVAMSYVVKGHAQRGSFDAKKALGLKLEPGPAYRLLTEGQSVKNKDGEIITPDMVLTPTRPGRGIAIFSIPSAEYLPDLEQQLEDQKDQLLEGIDAAVWMTRGSVLHSQQFQQLLPKLGGIRHIISDPAISNDYIVHESSALASVRLSNIASNFFSIPRYDNSDAYRPTIAKTTQSVRDILNMNDPSLEIVPAKRGLKIRIEPSFLLDDGEVPSDRDLRSVDLPLEANVRQYLPDDMSPYRKSTLISSRLDLDEPEIITLGTGSAAPSKYRNVSAILLRMPQGLGNYLFDCGEGTLGQLKRLYAAAQLDEILFNLKGIWISHLHADHHLGTMSVLQAAFQAGKRLSGPGRPPRIPPCLISERNMLDYVDEYQSILGIPTDSLCIPITCDWIEGMFLHGKPFDFKDMNVPIKELRTVRVNHCHGAQAVSVTFINDFKFSYSGDCRPAEMFCEIGADSDVLVHEATFDDGLEGDAMAKKHCTTGEAVGVALKMGAKNLILTHFSQRYQKIPVISNVKMPERVSEAELLDDVDPETTTGHEDETADTQNRPAPTSNSVPWSEPDLARGLNIGIAFDLMRVKVSQIASMKKLFPAITKMFEIEEEKREKLRLEASAAVQQEQMRKLAEKEKRQAANKQKKTAQSQAKQKATGEEKRRKRKPQKEEPAGDEAAMTRISNEPIDVRTGALTDAPMEVMAAEAEAEPETRAGEESYASTQVDAKSAQNGDRGGDGGNSLHVNVPTQVDASMGRSSEEDVKPTWPKRRKVDGIAGEG